MTTQLPPPGDNSIDDHVELSRRSIDHARRELERGERLQASEKVWGAAAHALKAIGLQRGWRHRSHANVLDIGEHLAREFDQEDEFNHYLNTADSMHTNFYENNRRTGAIRRAIEDVEVFLDRLDKVRDSAPRPYTVMDEDDRDRLRSLLGLRGQNRPRIGDYSNVGFSRNHPDSGTGQLR